MKFHKGQKVLGPDGGKYVVHNFDNAVVILKYSRKYPLRSIPIVDFTSRGYTLPGKIIDLKGIYDL